MPQETELPKLESRETSPRPELDVEEPSPLAQRSPPVGRLVHGVDAHLNPLVAMRSLLEELERALGCLGGMAHGHAAEPAPWLSTSEAWIPKIEVRESADSFVVATELPGIEPKDVELFITNDILTIRGERRREHDGPSPGIHRSERSYGHFERQVALPTGTDPTTIDARFHNGLLEVVAPLPRAGSARRIEVSSDTGHGS